VSNLIHDRNAATGVGNGGGRRQDGREANKYQILPKEGGGRFNTVGWWLPCVTAGFWEALLKFLYQGRQGKYGILAEGLIGLIGYWYVSNVSIIFDAPCLFIHHLLCVLLHFVAFYTFSRTNLLTRCHSASSQFSTIFVFQKSYTGNILGIGRNKSQSSYFSRSVTESKAETEGDQGPGAP
jgi:hypothetical protein